MNSLWQESRLLMLKTPDTSKSLGDVLGRVTGTAEQQDDELRRIAMQKEAAVNTSQKQLEVRNLLKAAKTELGEDKEKEILVKIERQRSTQELAAIEEEINNRVNYFRQWQSQLTGFEDIFATDKNLGTTFAEHQTNFQNLDNKEQEKVLRNLSGLIKNYTSQFEELYRIYGTKNKVPADIIEAFKARGRTNRAEFLTKLKASNNEFDQIQKSPGWKNLPPNEQARQIALYNELGLEARKIHLKNLSANLEPSELDQDFTLLKSISKAANLKLNHQEDFALLPVKEKAEIVGSARQELIQKIQAEFKPHLKAMSSKDQDVILVYLRKDPIDSLIYYFNSSKSYIKKIEEVANYIDSKNINEDTLAHFNWDNLYGFERHNLVSKGTLEKYENAEHMGLDKQYDQKIKAYLTHQEFGYINEKGAKAYKDWFRNLDLADKQEIIDDPELDYLNQTLSARQDNIDSFNALPAGIRKEYNQRFKIADFEGRSQMLLELESEFAGLKTKFTDKVDTKIENGLLAEKSRESYLSWFQEELSLKQMKKFLVSSDLDKKERQQIVNLWEKIQETDKFQALSKKEQNKLLDEFNDSNLEERIAFVKKHGESFYNNPDQSLNIKKEINKIKTGKKVSAKINQLDEQFDDLTEEGDIQESTGNFKKALQSYEKALKLIDPKTKPKEVTETKQKIAELKRMVAISEGDETDDALIAEVDYQIETMLHSPKLAKELIYNTILYMAYIATKNSELQSGTKNINLRAETIVSKYEDPEIDALNQAIQAETTAPTDDNPTLQMDRDNEGNLSLSTGTIFYAEDYTDKGQKDYNPEVIGHLANLQKLDARRQVDHTLQLTDPNYNPVSADQFYTRVYEPNQEYLKNMCADEIVGKHPDLNNQEAKNAYHKLVMERLSILPDHNFTTKLAKQNH